MLLANRFDFSFLAVQIDGKGSMIRTPTSALCPWHRPVKRSCSFEVNGWCTSDVYNRCDYHPGDFRAWYHSSICGKSILQI